MRMKMIWLTCFVVTALAVPARAHPQTTPVTPKKQAAKVSPPAPVPLLTSVQSEASGESAASKLPVRRVILYKTGVGYFEHLGQVRGDQKVQIDFSSSQLNDVLQSLTVLDLNGGRIAGVNYNSEAPLSQRSGCSGFHSKKTPTSRNFTRHCAAQGWKSAAAPR
jgi:hypothetical protein